MAADRCARCGELNLCGVAAGAASCWCFALPPVADAPAPLAGTGGVASARESCLCRRCLTNLSDTHPLARMDEDAGHEPATD